MKKRFVDPFTPDLPVDDPERFSGRQEQIEDVVDSLYQLANGNPTHTIVTGDRGIGKSSVLNQIKNLAEGNSALTDRLGIDIGLDRMDFVCAWHDCATDQTPSNLATGILRQLQTKLSGILKKLKIELNVPGIISIALKDSGVSSISEIVEVFCTELTKVAEQAQGNDKTGIILFFDELDRVDASSGIATFYKLAAERLSRDGVKSVAFFAAGITGAIQNLESEHASIYRTFKDVPLSRLNKPEVARILTVGFDAVHCKYEDQVINEIFEISAGFPEPVHLLGSQILSVDTDDHLTIEDFMDAKKKTVESIRKNKLASIVKSAGSGKYQKIIEAMAKYPGTNVPLKYISDETGYAQNQYSTNMGNLLKRNIISLVDRGVYSFVDPLVKEYISRFGVISADENEGEST